MSNEDIDGYKLADNRERVDCGNVSESTLNDVLVCDVIDEFIADIPKHINEMPAFNSNGVTRNEMEWKHLTFAMAKEIIRLREEN